MVTTPLDIKIPLSMNVDMEMTEASPLPPLVRNPPHIQLLRPNYEHKIVQRSVHGNMPKTQRKLEHVASDGQQHQEAAKVGTT
jgi:hypothetical protein